MHYFFMLISVQVQFFKHFVILRRLSLGEQVQVDGVNVILHVLSIDQLNH